MSIENKKEVIGYVSRWMLLVFCVIIVIWSIWTTILATSYIDKNLGSGFVVPDMMWYEGKKSPYLAGLPSPRIPGGRPPLAYCVDPLKRITPAQTNQYQGWLVCYSDKMPAGVHHFSIRGLPYSSLAFVSEEPKLFIIPPRNEIYLLDARLAVELNQTNKQMLDKILSHLNRLGLSAMFCVDPVEDYKSIRSKLSDYNDYPLLCSTEKRSVDIMTTIWRTRRTLRRPRNRYPFIITSDYELARQASAQYHYVHLIKKDSWNFPTYVKYRPNVRIHNSVADFEKYLMTEYSPFNKDSSLKS